MSVGGRGRYGWYEALDYTPSRVPEGEEVAIVRAYMAHHQGMTVVAIANALQDGIMRARFHAEPMVQATELLLQERPSRDIVVARPRADEVKAAARVRELIPPMLRRFRSPHGAVPRTHLLSNGRYSRDGHQCRRRLQPLARSRRDAVARGCDPRSLGLLRLPARYGQRRGVVGRLPAQRARGGQLRRHLLRGSGRIRPARRHASRPPR